MTAFGIDLGTTYSCIAYLDSSGRPVILQSRLGDDTTPSVVQFEADGSPVVGQTAKDFAKLDGENVVRLVKRDMGVEGAQYEFHGETQSPEAISAIILRELASAASESTGIEVVDVVITVPAYFGVAEKEATRKAGEIAGLNVLALVPEPVAAAIHYGDVEGSQEDRTILVFDLGGGTFDTTVIELSGDSVKVVCTDGNHQLGGASWDERLMDHLVEQFLLQHPEADPTTDENFMQDLENGAEQLKKYLSSANSRKHNLVHDGKSAVLEVTRDEFEAMTADLVDETMAITKRTIETAATKGVDGFDEVLLVGGSTRMPVITERLQEEFSFSPRVHDPDLAVAKGAARHATITALQITLGDLDEEQAQKVIESTASETGMSAAVLTQLSSQTIVSVVPRAFGVKLVDTQVAPDANGNPREFVHHLIPANTPLPATPDVFQAGTTAHNQTEIRIEAWEQKGAVEDEDLSLNAYVGEGLITGLPPLPAGSPVNITFAMDEHGVLDVHAVELSTNKHVQFDIQIKGLSDDEVAEAKEALSNKLTKW